MLLKFLCTYVCMNQSKSIIRLNWRGSFYLTSLEFWLIPKCVHLWSIITVLSYRIMENSSVFAHLVKYHYTIDEAYHIPFEKMTHFIFTSTTYLADTQYYYIKVNFILSLDIWVFILKVLFFRNNYNQL